MSLSRFYLAPAGWSGDAQQELGPEEGHHCIRVLRRRLGDEVELFDGAGRVARAIICGVQRERVTVELTACQQHPRLGHEIHLLPALIKGEAFEWLLEKAVELGAASVQPLATGNSVVQLGEAAAIKKQVKWQRQMLEAAKQCHTPFLPTLLPPKAMSQVLTELGSPSEGNPDELRLIPALSPECQTLHAALEAWTAVRPRRARVIIGPEGDFTADELLAAQAVGFQPVTLGRLILRAETAALAALAAITQRWVEPSPSVVV